MLWASVQLQRSHFTLFFSVGEKAENALKGIIAASHRWAISVRWDSQRLTCLKTLIQSIQIKQQIADCCLFYLGVAERQISVMGAAKSSFSLNEVMPHLEVGITLAPPRALPHVISGNRGCETEKLLVCRAHAAEVVTAPNKQLPRLVEARKKKKTHKNNTTHGLQGGRAGIFRCHIWLQRLCSPRCLCGRSSLETNTERLWLGRKILTLHLHLVLLWFSGLCF